MICPMLNAIVHVFYTPSNKAETSK